MTVASIKPKFAETQEGVSYPQAMDIWARWGDLEAAPTIAANTKIDWKTVCRVLDGNIWPGARRFWMRGAQT